MRSPLYEDFPMAPKPAHEKLEQRVKELEQEAVQLKQTEKKLREENKKLQEIEILNNIIFSSAGEGIIVYDNDLNIHSWNKFMENLSGMTKEEVIGKSAPEIFPHLKDVGTLDLMEQALNGKTVTSDFLPFKSPATGREGWSQGTYSPLISVDDTIAGIVAIVHDVTTRKLSEEALRESEGRFRILFENTASCIIFVVDRAMKYFNEATLDTFGYNRDEMFGKSTALIHASRKSYEEAGRIAYDALQKEGKWNGDLLFRKKNGETMWMNTNLSTLPEVGIVAVLNDVTEHRKAVEEKIELQKQLQQAHKMEAIGTLAGGIAHDFNNILSIILGNTELAIDDVPEWNPARHNLEETKSACLRAKDVVQQLLSFSKKSDSKQKPLKISPIINECLKFLRSTLPTSIEIRKTIEDDSGIISADPTQIHQVIMNLCTNAAHAMSENGGIMEVVLSVINIGKDEAMKDIELNQGQYVRLIVRDTGHGMPAEHLDKIFDPYFTTKEVGEGSGIGLSVVHSIVKSHEGAIFVESEYGKGTSVNVIFPIVGNEPASEKETATTIPMGNERILFVDDEKTIANITSLMLKRLGYTITTKTSSTDTLETFRRRPYNFDLIISDMSMPGITGDRLANKLQQIRPDIPIILCTGFSDRIDDSKAKSIGVRALVMKPIEKSVLAKTIREVLD